MPETTVSYESFLARKRIAVKPCGLEPAEPHRILFPFQRDIVKWALRRGRAAIWADCGLGKSFQQLEWARQIPGRVLILAPLAVAGQTVREGARLGLEVVYARRQEDAGPKLTITNYEMLEHFDPSTFEGVVLDESSILKAYDGKTRTQIIESFRRTPYRLACTATPSPNDLMELGNHAEFLGAMSRTEMLATWFVHDGGDTSEWRLKGHAAAHFWRWVCEWAVMVRRPSDLGYEDGAFTLPPLSFRQHVVKAAKASEGMLFATEAQTLSERREARQNSLDDRVALAAGLVNSERVPWVAWCDLNAEGDALEDAIDGSVQVSGSDSIEEKETKLRAFSAGEARVLISKPSICGWGLNWQHCSRMAFVGLSDSYEALYQAVRRCWRFGQTKAVEAHVVTSDAEGAVVRNIERKETDAKRMADEMVRHMAEINRENIQATNRTQEDYRPMHVMELPEWVRSEQCRQM